MQLLSGEAGPPPTPTLPVNHNHKINWHSMCCHRTVASWLSGENLPAILSTFSVQQGYQDGARCEPRSQISSITITNTYLSRAMGEGD